jgi:hypothetical protein
MRDRDNLVRSARSWNTGGTVSDGVKTMGVWRTDFLACVALYLSVAHLASALMCTDPGAAGYQMTNTELDTTQGFDVTGVCAAGYMPGTVTVTACTISGAYSVSGCAEIVDCIDDATFDAGFGACATYAPDQVNHALCETDGATRRGRFKPFCGVIFDTLLFWILRISENIVMKDVLNAFVQARRVPPARPPAVRARRRSTSSNGGTQTIILGSTAMLLRPRVTQRRPPQRC